MALSALLSALSAPGASAPAAAVAGAPAAAAAAAHDVPPSGPPPTASTPPELAALFASARLTHGAPTASVVDVHRPAAPALDDTARAALHAQAVGVLNVKALVPVTLDVANSNYTRWRGLFLVALGKYALTDHVLSDVVHFDRADWVQMDCVVLGWLFGTISADLLQDVLSTDTTARVVWLGLEHQFLGNSEQRAQNLTTAFHTFQQGDLTVDEYCRKMKAFADDLGDVGEPVRDRTLVLNTLNGLSEKFHNLGSLVPMQRPFPTFVEFRSMLRLEELSKSPRSTSSSAVFLANATGGNGCKGTNPAHNTGYGSGSGGSQGNAGNGKGNGRRRRGGGGGNSNSSGNGGGGGGVQQTSQGKPNTAWPSPHNPWAGTIHMWPGPLSRGLLGPRPLGVPFAGAAVAGPPVGSMGGLGTQVCNAPLPPVYQGAGGLGQMGQVGQLGPSQPPTLVALQQSLGWFGGAPSQWDQASLAGSFTTTTLPQPAAHEWYMDTGATAHMTSDTGILSFTHSPNPNSPSHIVVGNGSTIPVTSIGQSNIRHPNRSFTLRDILYSPAIIKNLIYVRRFVIDNWCSVEFDPFGFSVKDLRTKTVIARFNSSGPLYSLHHVLPSPPATTALITSSTTDVL